jgi:hypothetical protein
VLLFYFEQIFDHGFGEVQAVVLAEIPEVDAALVLPIDHREGCVCICVCMYVCMYVCLHEIFSENIWLYVCMRMYECMYAYIYIYIYE